MIKIKSAWRRYQKLQCVNCIMYLRTVLRIFACRFHRRAIRTTWQRMSALSKKKFSLSTSTSPFLFYTLYPYSIMCGNQIHTLQLQTQPKGKVGRKRQRVVRFATLDNDETVSTSGAPSLFQNLTLDKCRELWYQRAEISGFKKEVANIIMIGTHFDKAVLGDLHCGLERHNFERASAKKETIRLVLNAQKLPFGSDFLHQVSEEMSQPARDIAVVQGLSDFCNAYYGILPTRIPQEPEFSCKRSMATSDERRVRRRTMP